MNRNPSTKDKLVATMAQTSPTSFIVLAFEILLELRFGFMFLITVLELLCEKYYKFRTRSNAHVATTETHRCICKVSASKLQNRRGGYHQSPRSESTTQFQSHLPPPISVEFGALWGCNIL
mmetsp:Transcript_7812/g.12637  ORF Transcript_7812/g.12637 Transcript_7812/m.12637 type:complete len:121 (+) Transcript_7812:1021-1383(+)